MASWNAKGLLFERGQKKSNENARQRSFELSFDFGDVVPHLDLKEDIEEE